MLFDKEVLARFKTVSKRSKKLPEVVQFEIEQMMEMNIRIESIGNENLYFFFVDEKGAIKNGYCKCL